jgi:hypothetical protein
MKPEMETEEQRVLTFTRIMCAEMTPIQIARVLEKWEICLEQSDRLPDRVDPRIERVLADAAEEAGC